MLPMIVSAGGFRLLVGAIPLVLLLSLAGLVVLLAMLMPEDRRRFVLKLAPHVEAAIAAIAGNRRTPPS